MILIDFEFTGLDNDFVKDNEIVQMKMLNTINGDARIMNFRSKKDSVAGAYLKHRIGNNPHIPFFNSSIFYDELAGFDKGEGLPFIGFDPKQDLQMLAKYGIRIKIEDLKEYVRIYHERRMALEGSSLECCYYIMTGKLPNLQHHGDLDEMGLMLEIYKEVSSFTKPLQHYTFMPYGFCAGMPIIDYVQEYRKQADGYRFNNSDILAGSFNYYIAELEAPSFDDDDNEDYLPF